MNLPNYFLADLPPEAPLTATILGAACETLVRNREQYLAHRPTRQLIGTLSDLAARWVEPEFAFRRRVLELGPRATGFSAETLAAGLDEFFNLWTPENLQRLLLQDLGHLERLDAFSATDLERRANLGARVRGPEMLVHITGGLIPNPVLTSILLGFLLRSAQFVKCASGAALIPRMFAHSLYEADPKLGACLEIAEWKGGNAALESALFQHADCVTAMGHNDTVAAIRRRLPLHVRVVGYGHRVSFVYVAQDALSHPRKVAAAAARDIAAWDQLGCLSPQVIYVEGGGRVAPEQFAELLAEELEAKERSQPRGRLGTEKAADIASRRAFYEIRAAHSTATRLWMSKGSTAWTVVFELDPRFQGSCLHRFIYVKATADLPQALQSADPVRGQVSTVGLAATEDQAPILADQLARWGVSRICPVGQMQNPPLTWRHDGRPSLGDLVTWTDWQQI